MGDVRRAGGYSRQFALRQPPPAPRTSQLNLKKAGRKPTRKAQEAAASGARGAPSRTEKTLVDAFKQYGMRLCDGARLNAVGKGITALGLIPSTLSASVTALYLSQNDLRTLEGVEQFAAVRLLSVGGNLICAEKEVARLTTLKQLRNLNLMGNPLCDQPSYRLRVIATLKQLQVLDNIDITKKEKEAAAQVAAQDDALRAMVTQNHFEIQKLQRIAPLILVHKEFYGRVLAGVALGKFDRVPSPSDVACNVALLLRLWRYQDTLSETEKEALRDQMLTIVVRTHAKLADHPKVKAKEYLLKLAKGSSPRAQRPDGFSSDVKHRSDSWEEAYSNVIALQQKTLANLHALCEQNRRDMIEFLKNLLSMDPSQRDRIVGVPRVHASNRLEKKPRPRNNSDLRKSYVGSRLMEKEGQSHIGGDACSVHHQLPPQQQDPELSDKDMEMVSQGFVPSAIFVEQSSHRLPLPSERKQQASGACYQQVLLQGTKDRKATLRNGDFANKSLGEAIHSFKLRGPITAPPTKPSRLVPPPTKIPQVHCAFPVHRLDTPPLPPELVAKQLPPFPGRFPGQHPGRPLAGCNNNNHEADRNHRDSEAATDVNSCDRRASSILTREELDMTNISETSSASSSPRTSHPTEEAYVPIARCPPNLRNINSDVPTERRSDARPRHTTHSSQSSARTNSAPDDEAEQSIFSVPSNDNRLQELERREEKYIRALMQSEQRELDLRNNLSSVQRKLASYQNSLSQQLQEQEAIKEEVNQRIMAVAAPKIYKRYFIRWIQFYNWSLQIKHVRRKRCFIVQHDRFWIWRRKVWLQQELRACLNKHQRRMRWVHFNEWVNATRVTVIARRTQTLQDIRNLTGSFRAWIEVITSNKRTKQLQQEKQNGKIQTLQRLCFREWKRITRYNNTLEKVQELRWKDSQRANRQIVFWSWKLYLFSVARPLHERSARLRHELEHRRTRHHFHAWRKLIIVDKMHAARLRRRIWRRWVGWRRRTQSKRNAAQKEMVAIVNVYFCAWHNTASDQAITRRSLNLAKRYVNRRRLRKLWMHWKYFSMARRKYTQDSTKSLKHYFMKLLRSSWKMWKGRTHANLQRAKANKFGTLQRHFDAFRAGIRFVVAQRARARMLAHIEKRRQRALTRRVLGHWREYTAKWKRFCQNAQIVSVQRKQGALTAVWRQWRCLHTSKLHRQMVLLRKSYDSIVSEKHELEAHLEAAKATTISLGDQIELLHGRLKSDHGQVADLEQKLLKYEDHNALLESDLKDARSAIERERHAWEDALCDEEEKRESDARKYRSLAQENQVLQVQAIELKRELEMEKSKVLGGEKIIEELRAQLESVAQSHQVELSTAADKRKELEQEIAHLYVQLKDQETEREDTANRLQEYEKRIASTCEAMNEHERAYELENESLRSECATMESKWKEEQVRNAELSRLVQEKNVLLLDMTNRTKLEDCSSHSGRLDAHPESEHYGGCSNQDECSMRAVENACRHQPPAKVMSRATECCRNSVPTVQSTELSRGYKSTSLKTKRPSFRRSAGNQHADMFPIDSCSRLKDVGSAAEVAVSAEEDMIDEHTSKVHEDIRLLQARISRRLEQAPAIAELRPRLLQRARQSERIASISSLSDEESDSTLDEYQSVSERVRRARLRRLQTQKEAMITAVSPMVSRLSSLKPRERGNNVVTANTFMKRATQKAKSGRLPANRPNLKSRLEKKLVKPQL